LGCAHCGGPVTYGGVGRPPVYCSPRCRDTAFRDRRTGLAAIGRKIMTDVDLGGPLPTLEELENEFFERQLAAVEGRRDAALVKSRREREEAAEARRVDATWREADRDLAGIRYGGALAKVFVDWIAGRASPEVIAKAALVEDAAGEVLIPTPITIDILNVARETGTLRSLADVRPTTGSKQRASLLSAAATGWGKLETGTSATDANVTPAAVAPDPIPVYDLVAMALIGVDELADSPASAQASIVDAVGSAIGDAEDTAFAAGTGSGQPSGFALAANVTLVPAGQKTAAGASNTPVLADMLGLPWKLPTRFRDRASWLMHPTAASKIAAITFTNGSPLWPNPGNPDPRAGGGLMGWPAYVIDGLPDPASAGTTDASVWFTDVRSMYRVVDRQRVTVQVLRQRFAEQGMVGLIVRERVGGDMVRPTAAAIYTL
jgi:HK97 family phage major capsid protein